MAEQELLAPGAVINANRASFSGAYSNGPMQALSNFGRQPALQRALPAIGMIAALGLAGAAYYSLQTPAQAPLFQGLPDSDKAAVADALQSSGINYTIDSGSGSINVDEDKVHQARILLAGQGLPKAAPAGDAMMAALPMGSSRALEGETLRAAREADLSRTIEAIDAVKTARIHLATPEPSVFVRENAAPAASVMLTMQQGRTLSDAQVRAIRHLVAASVPGMTPEQVSIVDQSGALLSQNDSNGDDRNFQLQVQMEARYREALNALLSPIVGLGNYSLEVHADVDSTESQSTRETYPKDDNALRREEGNTQNSETISPPASGIPGATSNQPPQATIVAAKPDRQQNSPQPGVSTSASDAGQKAETYARSFDVGREISVTHNPRGRISRLSVAVALRDTKGAKPRTAAEVEAIGNLVKGAVGFNAERGDVVAISSRKFAEVEAVVTNLWDEAWFMPAMRQIGAILMALLVLLFIGRPLIKMLRGKAQANKEHEEALTQQLLEVTRHNPSTAVSGAITLEMIESAPSYEARANLVRSFVRQDSQRAALVVRQLMQETNDDR
jgi:flagellar M-ring protein FliF